MLRQIYNQKIKIRKELTNEINMGSLAEHISTKLGASVTQDTQSASLFIKTDESCSYEDLNPILEDWTSCNTINPMFLYDIMPLMNHTFLVKL